MPATDDLTPEARQPHDLAAERARSRLDAGALAAVFAGSAAARDRARWLLALLRDDGDAAFDKQQRPFQGRYERFMHGQRLAQRYFELRNRHGLAKEDRDRLRLYLDEYISLQVHESMGQPTIQSQASDAQWRRWGKHIESGRWLTCYAQTELAHGSNLSGLRTTATYDTYSNKWEIHTPEPSAGKTWIGGAGSSATHAVVMAQMCIGGRQLGMHPFLVPLRDPDTHELLPGVEAIDMGPKVGAPAMDNGYITFTRVKIPRTNLLDRFQVVHPDGRYEQRNKEGKALTRGGMTLVRVGLVEIAAHHAARATVIAMRYAVVRRQGSSATAGGLEPQIIDYAGLQARLFVCLSTSWALTLTGQHMRRVYNDLQAELQAGQSSGLLGIVHGMTSILKACATQEGLAVVETARRSMGGHGYSAASGLADLERNQPTANLTYEGDNNMLLGGPAANFLVKSLRAGGLPSRAEFAFLRSQDVSPCASQTSQDFLRPEVQAALLAHRAARLVRALDALRAAPAHEGSAYLDAALAARASRAAGSVLIVHAFAARIAALRSGQAGDVGAPLTPELLDALQRMCAFYTLEVCVLRELGDYTEDGHLNAQQADAIRAAAAGLASAIRQDALALAEAADMDDWYLGSPLGHSDGRAYDRMIAWMRLEPLNQQGDAGGRDARGVLKDFRQGIGRLTHGEVEQWNEAEAARQTQLRRDAKL